MLFEEYKKTFEKVLSVTEKIKSLVEKGKGNETEALFIERAMLMEKLEIPDDIDEKKFEEILLIKEKISQLNAEIIKSVRLEGEKLRKSLEELKKQAQAYNQRPEEK